MKLTCNKAKPPLAGIITAEYLKQSHKIEIGWDNETRVENSENRIDCITSNEVCRALVRLIAEEQLYGSNTQEKTEVDHWLTYSIGPISYKNEFSSAVSYLNKTLGPVTYLVGKRLTIADFSVFAALYASKEWHVLLSKQSVPSHLLRWYNLISSHKAVINTLENLPEEAKTALKPVQSLDKSNVGQRNQEGKFIDLPGAEMGKVVVRFPPEASGYLHIGHAKAALLNQYYQQAFQGKLIMRFDDTNPAKENVHFEQVILQDLEMLQIKPDLFTHTSDYFDLMLEYCEKLLKDGKAYVDDTEPELMKQQREQRIECANRNNSVEQNFALWEEMKKGTERGQKCCVRAKIDMQSPNGCMRDPTIYRCKNEIHPKTGDKYKVYPTYDFACPIVDAIENVTHTLRTMEYHDRDAQFYWFIEALGLRRPHIWEYSRLSMTNTVLSKRKLTWFVQEGLVDGWDDPRFPTVRGVLRRGMTVEGLKQFIIAQGSSRSVVFMEWDKIWAFNKKVIDPIAPRYTAVNCYQPVPVLVKGQDKEEVLTAPLHPKNSDVGTKKTWIGPRILIDYEDAECLKEGENTTFINWGNLLIKKVNRENNKIVSVEAETNLDNKDYKKTLKLTWLCDTEKAKFTPTWVVYFDHIINKALLGKDEDFKTYIGHKTRFEYKMLGDPELKNLKIGDIIQLQRRGFFRVDVNYEEYNPDIGMEKPIVLFHIPDGHAKENPFPKYKYEEPERSPFNIHTDLIKEKEKLEKLKTGNAAQSDLEQVGARIFALKKEYHEVAGSEWTPDCAPPAPVVKEAKPVLEPKTIENHSTPVPTNDESVLLEKITLQGDKVRELKSKKADKSSVDAEVKVLLSLKADYKSLTGKDWKPGAVATPAKVPSVNEEELSKKIAEQGDHVRKAKAEKADKSVIDAQVKILLALKADYKAAFGKDWKPGSTKPVEIKSAPNITASNTTASNITEVEILEKITAQGDKVRKLKSEKAEKSIIDTEVKALLGYKAEYKKLTGKEWKPGTVASTPNLETSVSNNTVNEMDLCRKITEQGNKVRSLKAEKAAKNVIDVEVKALLAYKAQYKELTGKDWKPENAVSDPSPVSAGSVSNTSISEAQILEKITAQGDKVRKLKSEKAEKNVIDVEVKALLAYKSEYKTLTGKDWKPGLVAQPAVPVSEAQNLSSPQEINATISQPSPKHKEPKATTEKVSKQAASKKNVPKEKKPVEVASDSSNVKKQTRLGLEAKKEENLADWYSQVITKGEMIEYYDVSGCYIFRPWSYAIWEAIKDWFDGEIKKLGVQNCYFPIFVSKNVLEKEKTHIADFAPEVAWVTKSGDSEMAEPIAVRPTSETVMYPAYAKWIQSYRDLPVKLNQWNNVVRWEFKHPQPFIRTREFLWQEGHTAYAVKEEADVEVSTILDLYARIYTDLLAIPVIKGRKTEKEKFAGGDYTLTVEAYVSASGRGIQGATSHHLGQNFSKMFDITFEDPDTQEKKYVYQNSWGITTRTIGVLIMIHADNQGLVLPPHVASIQIVIVPCGITVSLAEAEKNALDEACSSLERELAKNGVRVKGDYRSNYSPGWKFNHWELKGVPIRVEYGPKDLKNKQLVAVRRDTGEKITIKLENAVNELTNLLEEIHKNLYNKALADLNSHMVTLTEWSQFGANLDKKNIILAPFCGEISCEDQIKRDSTREDIEAEPGAPAMGAKSLCIPLEPSVELKPTDKCIHPNCQRNAKFYTLFGRSY